MPSPRLLEALSTHALRQPERIALLQGGRSVTYRQLDQTAAWFRTRLADLKLGPDRPVCVPAHKNAETIALIIACFQAGVGVLAPSADLGEESLATLSSQARCSHLLLAASDAEGPALTARPVPADEQAAAGFRRVDPDHCALLLTTSGSTGAPKIVPIRSAGFDGFAGWATRHFGLTAEDTALSHAPLNFDLSLLDVWVFLGLGARVVLADKSLGADARRMRQTVLDHRVSFVQGVPGLYRMLVQDGGRFPAVRTLITTGDSLPVGLLREVTEAFPGARCHNVFGCTETNDSFVHELSADHADEQLPIGRPIAGVAALLVDDGDVVTGPGTGELWVSTPFQTTGYLESCRDEGVFVPSPSGGADVFYRTGDIVTRLADGTHFLRGRRDFQVKVRGIRTNVQEVENVLAAHPDVAEAVVVALPDEAAGHRLHAQVMRRSQARLSSLGLRSHAAKRLPLHAVPSSVQVQDAPLPHTTNGKPDRDLIKKIRMKGKKK